MNIPCQVKSNCPISPSDHEEAVSCLLALGYQQHSHPKPSVNNFLSDSKPLDSLTITSDESVSNHSVTTMIVSDDDNSWTTNCHESIHSREATSKSENRTNSGKFLPMPEILMRLLLDPVFEDMITFLPDESSFVVLSPQVFSSLILPRFFSMTRFTSFVRKLEHYGFEQFEFYGITRHPAFRHPLFRKNEPELCQRILFKSSRKNNKNSVTKRSNKTTRSIGNGDNTSVRTQDEGKKKKEKGPLNRQLILKAQLRAREEEHNELSTKDNVPFDRNNFRRSFQKISPEDDVIKATRSIVGAAIDCLLVDEDHTRNLLARHSLRLRLQRNSIFPSGLLMHELIQKKSNSLSFHLSDIIEQKLGRAQTLQNLEHNENISSLLKGNGEFTSGLNNFMAYSIPTFR